jgi:hypothetical protein
MPRWSRCAIAPPLLIGRSEASTGRRDGAGLIAEERIGADDQRAGMSFDEKGEGGVDLVFGTGLQGKELHPLCARRFLHISYHALGSRIGGLDPPAAVQPKR